MCAKFHYDRLRNDRALGNGKSDNNKNNNNVGSHWGPKNRAYSVERSSGAYAEVVAWAGTDSITAR